MTQEQNIFTVANRGPVIPVIVLDDVSQAVPLAHALVAGGIDVMEVTLRTGAALDCIRAISREVPQAIVGAGSILTREDAQRAAEAGAKFAVSPGLTDRVAEACRALSLPLLPGVATASEIMQARELGLEVLKFFPATACGGVDMLKAWAGPFQDVFFCPTGGITPVNAPDFLALRNVVCVGGSWVVSTKAIQNGDWELITRLARQASQLERPGR